MDQHTGGVNSVSMLPDGSVVVSGSMDSSIMSFSLTTRDTTHYTTFMGAA